MLIVFGPSLTKKSCIQISILTNSISIDWRKDDGVLGDMKWINEAGPYLVRDPFVNK